MLGVIRKHRLLYGATVVLLTLVFLFNVFGVKTSTWFSSFQADSDALVMHKLACRDELQADNFGNMLVAPKNPEKFATNKLSPECQPSNSKAYVSQFGLQGKIAGVGYNALHLITGIPLHLFLSLLQVFWAIVSALTLGLFVVWVAERYGRYVGWSVLGFLSLSVWVVGFGRNTYWAMPFLFLPFIFTLYYYSRQGRNKPYLLFLGGLFLLFFLRFLNGYEFISTVVLAPIAALVLLAHGQVDVRRFVKEAGAICAIGFLAFAAAFALNFMQVYQYTGSAAKASAEIAERALLRTTGGEGYRSYVYSGLGESVPEAYGAIHNYVSLDVTGQPSLIKTYIIYLINYALLPVVNVPLQIREPLYSLLSSFSFYVLLAWLAIRSLRRNADKAQRKTYDALYWAMVAGLVASLSWLVVGHSHSLVHAHLIGITYYLPFMLLVYIVLGLWLEKQTKLLVRTYGGSRGKRGRV